MSDAEFTLPSIKFDVELVCNSALLPQQPHPIHKTSFAKTKFVSAHPILPLILSLDEYGNISLWDSQLRQMVWASSGFQLQKEAILQAYHAQIPSKDEHKKFAARSKHASLARLNGPALRNMGNIVIPNMTPMPSDSYSAPSAVPNEVLKDFLGDIKAVDFADPEYILAQGGKNLQFPHLNLSTIEASAQHRLTFLFDQAIVVYNYQQGKVLSILKLNTDLANKLMKPTCWEWLTVAHLAVGAADGHVRVFEDQSLAAPWKSANVPGGYGGRVLGQLAPKNLYKTMNLIHTFSIHQFTNTCTYQPTSASFPAPSASTGEVSILRTIPSVMEILPNTSSGDGWSQNNDEYESRSEEDDLFLSLQAASQHTVQLLSVSSDGSIFAWRLTYFSTLQVAPLSLGGASLESGFVGTEQPIARLSEGILGGLSPASTIANLSSTNVTDNSNMAAATGGENASLGATNYHVGGITLQQTALNSQTVIISNPIPARYDRQHRLLIDYPYQESSLVQQSQTAIWESLSLAALRLRACPLKIRSMTLQVLVSEGVVRVFDLTAMFLLPVLLQPDVSHWFPSAAQLPTSPPDPNGTSIGVRRNSGSLSNHFSSSPSKRVNAPDGLDSTTANAASVSVSASGKKESKKSTSLLASVFTKSRGSITNPSFSVPSSSAHAAVVVGKVENTNGAFQSSNNLHTFDPVILHLSAYAALKPGKSFSDNLRKHGLSATGLASFPFPSAARPLISGLYLYPAKHDELAIVYNTHMAHALFHHHRQHLQWQQRLLHSLHCDVLDLGDAYANILASLEPFVPPPPSSSSSSSSSSSRWNNVNSMTGTTTMYNSTNNNHSNVYSVHTNMEFFGVEDFHFHDPENDDNDRSLVDKGSAASSLAPAPTHIARTSSLGLKRRPSSQMRMNMNTTTATATAATSNITIHSPAGAWNIYGVNVKQVSAWRLESVQTWMPITDAVVAYMEKLFALQGESMRDVAPSYATQRMAQVKEAWSFEKTDRLKIYGVSTLPTSRIVLSTNIGAIVVRIDAFYPPSMYPGALSPAAHDHTTDSISLTTWSSASSDKQHMGGAGDGLYRQDLAYIAEWHSFRRRVLYYPAVAGGDSSSQASQRLPAAAAELILEETVKLPPFVSTQAFTSLALPAMPIAPTTATTQATTRHLWIDAQILGGGLRPQLRVSLCRRAVSCLFPSQLFYTVYPLPEIYASSVHTDASQDDSAPHKGQVHCGVLNPLGFGRASHLAWTLVPSSPASSASASASSASTSSSSASISDEHRAENPYPFEHQQPQSVCLFHVPPHFVDETDAVTLAAAEQLKAQLEHDQQQQAKKSKRLSLSLFGGFQTSQSKSASTGHEGTLWRLKKKAVVASLQATLLTTNRPSEHGSHPPSSIRAVALKPLTLRLQESPTSPPSAAPIARRGSRDATAAPPATTTDGSEGTATLASDVRDIFSGPVATITYLLPKSTQLVSQMFSLQHFPSHPPPPPHHDHHEQSQRQGHPQDKQEMDGGGESHASSASRAVCSLTAVSPLLPPMVSLHWHAISNPKTTTTASPSDSGRYEAEGILQQNRADPLLHSSSQTLRFQLCYRSSPTGGSSAILSSGTGYVE